MTSCPEIQSCITGVVIAPPDGENSGTNLGQSIVNIAAWTVAGMLAGMPWAGPWASAGFSAVAATIGELPKLFPSGEEEPITIPENADLKSDASFETLFGAVWPDPNREEFMRSVSQIDLDNQYAWQLATDSSMQTALKMATLYNLVQNPVFDFQNMTEDQQTQLYDSLQYLLAGDASTRTMESFQANVLSTIALEAIVRNNPLYEDKLRESLDVLEGESEASLLGSLLSQESMPLTYIYPLIESLDVDRFISLGQDPFLLSQLGMSAMSFDDEMYQTVLKSPELIDELAGSPLMTV